MNPHTHIVVVGAGIGGLTTAALLAKSGYRVTVLEAQTYPGGCASTWTHKGYRFESGATVAGGFQPGGPHHLAAELLGIDWPVHQHDPAWVVHLPDRSVALTQDNADVLDKFPESAHFWQQQAQVAELGWQMSAAGLPWPPRSAAEAAQIAKVGLRFFPRDLAIVPYALGTVGAWLKRRGLSEDHAFVRFLDGQLLISAQTTTQHVNAMYGATALDLARQGVYHVEGGIGGLADTLADTVRGFGGEIHYRQRATRFEVRNGRVTGVWTKQGRRAKTENFFPADAVVGNLTPWDVDALLADHSPAPLHREAQNRRKGWGAFVLHLGVRADAFAPGTPDHHQILTKLEGPLGEGRSLFISMSPEWDNSRAPAGQRAVTITTHTDPQAWWDLLRSDEDAYYQRKDAYAAQMIGTVDDVLPGFADAVTLTLPGTPVTYQFYTDRHEGMVGGFPQTSLFNARGPRTGIPNLRIVGDSIFPGQSTAGVTLGALRVWRDLLRTQPLGQTRVQATVPAAPAEVETAS